MKCDCDFVRQQLSLYIDGKLSDEEAKNISGHLQICSACREEHDFLNSIVKTAASMPALTVSEDLHSKIMQGVTVAATPKKTKSGRKSPWRLVSSVAAAAAVVAISVISFGSLPGHPDPTPNTQPEVIQSAQLAEAQKEQTQRSASRENPEAKQTQATPKPVAVPSPPTNNTPEENALVDVAMPESRAVDLSAQAEVEPILFYYFTEESLEKAAEILSGFEKEGEAYRIPVADLETVCARLESESGYLRFTGEKDTSEPANLILIGE